MSWAVGFDKHWQRDIGYGVPAWCDHPGCYEEIDRGLAYVCGGDPYGGEHGCGLYFCYKHLYFSEHLCSNLCERCFDKKRRPFRPSADKDEWIEHKMTDPSWAEWRAEQRVESTEKE